jgi:hypothetical protein
MANISVQVMKCGELFQGSIGGHCRYLAKDSNVIVISKGVTTYLTENTIFSWASQFGSNRSLHHNVRYKSSPVFPIAKFRLDIYSRRGIFCRTICENIYIRFETGAAGLILASH